MNPAPDPERTLVEEYLRSRRQYEQVRGNLFPVSPVVREPVLLRKIRKATKNVVRYGRDVWQKTHRRVAIEDVVRARVSVTVFPRRKFLTSALFKSLYARAADRRTLRSFMDLELYQELDCSHFLMIQGLTVGQFHRFIEHIGQNPKAFFSDDRGENGGRVAIDNMPPDGRHPFMVASDPDYTTEMEFWKPIWPRASERSFVSRWMVSRTHGLIYRFGPPEREMLIIPIHVDPKNVVMFFGEFFGAKKIRGPHALSYHQIPVGEPEYAGTGLYRLGCRIFLSLLDSAHAQGVFSQLKLHGDLRGLRSETSIVRSERGARRARMLLRQSQLGLH